VHPCELRPLLLTVSSHKVAYTKIEMYFAALELHLAMSITWIVAGLTCLDFINPGLTRIRIRVSGSSG